MKEMIFKNTSQDPAAAPLLSNGSWAFAESYKAARTNLSFLLQGPGCKVVAVAGALAGAGASVSAINLALSFAQIGKKVLLIDCDMRLPEAAKKLGIEDAPGIADVLSGQAAAEDAIQKPGKYDIDVLPAGNIPADPTKLLQSAQLGELFEALKESYDNIFVDVPAVLSVSDPCILSSYVDGYVLVVREDSSRYRDIADALRQIDMVGGKVLGFLYNDARPSRRKYYKKSR